MTNSPIDEAILSVVGERWMKVARVIVQAAKAMGGNLSSQAEKYEVIGQHIESLVRDGRLTIQGDVKRWRFSEVRRTDSQSNDL
jgi:hypothetical protein